MKKLILLLITLLLPGCFWSQASDKAAVIGKMNGSNYQCRYMVQSQYNCGVDLVECVVDGRSVARIVCAENVVVSY